jgi:hypothetical protein
VPVVLSTVRACPDLPISATLAQVCMSSSTWLF